MSKETPDFGIESSSSRQRLMLRRRQTEKASSNETSLSAEAVSFTPSEEASTGGEACESEPLVLDVDKPCARCSIVNINTQSGVMDKTVLSSLSFLGKSGGAAPSFGLFVKVRAGHGNVGKMMLLAEGSPMR
jgi:hypothetical protein